MLETSLLYCILFEYAAWNRNEREFWDFISTFIPVSVNKDGDVYLSLNNS